MLITIISVLSLIFFTCCYYVILYPSVVSHKEIHSDTSDGYTSVLQTSDILGMSKSEKEASFLTSLQQRKK